MGKSGTTNTDFQVLKIKGITVRLYKWQTEPFTNKILQQLQEEPKVVIESESVLRRSHDHNVPDLSNIANYVECSFNEDIYVDASYQGKTFKSSPKNVGKEDIEDELSKMFESTIELTDFKEQPKTQSKKNRKSRKAKKRENLRELLIELFGSTLDDIEASRPTPKKIKMESRRHTLPVSINIDRGFLKPVKISHKRKSETDAGIQCKMQRVEKVPVTRVLDTQYTSVSDLVIPPVYTETAKVTHIELQTAVVTEQPHIKQSETVDNTLKASTFIDLTSDDVFDTGASVIEFEGIRIEIKNSEFKGENFEASRSSEQANVPVAGSGASMPLLSPVSPAEPTKAEAVLPQGTTQTGRFTTTQRPPPFQRHASLEIFPLGPQSNIVKPPKLQHQRSLDNSVLQKAPQKKRLITERPLLPKTAQTRTVVISQQKSSAVAVFQQPRPVANAQPRPLANAQPRPVANTQTHQQPRPVANAQTHQQPVVNSQMHQQSVVNSQMHQQPVVNTGSEFQQRSVVSAQTFHPPAVVNPRTVQQSVAARPVVSTQLKPSQKSPLLNMQLQLNGLPPVPRPPRPQNVTTSLAEDITKIKHSIMEEIAQMRTQQQCQTIANLTNSQNNVGSFQGQTQFASNVRQPITSQTHVTQQVNSQFPPQLLRLLPHTQTPLEFQLISNAACADRLVPHVSKLINWKLKANKFFEETKSLCDARERPEVFSKLRDFDVGISQIFGKKLIKDLSSVDVQNFALPEILTAIKTRILEETLTASVYGICYFLHMMIHLHEERCTTPFLKKFFTHVKLSNDRFDQLLKQREKEKAVPKFTNEQFKQLEVQIRQFWFIQNWLNANLPRDSRMNRAANLETLPQNIVPTLNNAQNRSMVQTPRNSVFENTSNRQNFEAAPYRQPIQNTHIQRGTIENVPRPREPPPYRSCVFDNANVQRSNVIKNMQSGGSVFGNEAANPQRSAIPQNVPTANILQNVYGNEAPAARSAPNPQMSTIHQNVFPSAANPPSGGNSFQNAFRTEERPREPAANPANSALPDASVQDFDTKLCLNSVQMSTEPDKPCNSQESRTESVIAVASSAQPEEVSSTVKSESKDVIDLTWIDDGDENEILEEIIECKSFPFKIETGEGREVVSPTDSGLGSPAAQQSDNDTFKCLCGQRAIYVCACNSSIYCSSECQESDWEYHQEVCHKRQS